MLLTEVFAAAQGFVYFTDRSGRLLSGTSTTCLLQTMFHCCLFFTYVCLLQPVLLYLPSLQKRGCNKHFRSGCLPPHIVRGVSVGDWKRRNGPPELDGTHGHGGSNIRLSLSSLRY